MARGWMHMVIAALIAITALGVVVSKHRARALVDAQQHLDWERDRLESEWAQLQLEEASLAAHGRVERVARERLNMAEPDRFVPVAIDPVDPVSAGSNP